MSEAMIKAYVSQELKNDIEGIAKENNLSVSKIITMAVSSPEFYVQLMRKYIEKKDNNNVR